MMYFTDTSSGRPLVKDPAVVYYNSTYFMYYSLPPKAGAWEEKGWSIGIAVSKDLQMWDRIGRLKPEQEVEKNGFCAPGAIVLNDRIHLFYQSYGNFPADKICHAYSTDGIHFTRNKENPVFGPTGNWTNGRAIDADVLLWKEKLFLYYATRDTEGKIQKLGVCAAPLDSDFGSRSWTQLCKTSILQPELDWETGCLEAPATCVHEGRVYLFYGGGYNNQPQQIGCAVSEDGIHFERLFYTPFLKNGAPGQWNSSESGHPFVFQDKTGQYYLFYQGNNDNGQSWYLSNRPFEFKEGIPILQNMEGDDGG